VLHVISSLGIIESCALRRFFSYAHEDKLDVAMPLAQHLRDLGLSVWIDDLEMNVWDNISDRIERGLESSDFGVVVLFKALLQ